MTQLQCIWS